MKLIDLTGTRFGRLVVTGRGPNNKQGRPMWHCLCDCGKATIVFGGSLQQKLTISCGCFRQETGRASLLGKPCTNQIDATGERHGWLVALRRTDEKYHEGWLWEWQCDCGKLAIGTLGQVRSGHKASCGCAKRDGVAVRSDKIRSEHNATQRVRYRADTKYRICQIVAAQMRNTLKRAGSTKLGRTFTILGYTPAELEKHLRKTLPEGWTWEDFMSGALHIDHRIPLAAFNFTTQHDHDFKLAWALSNLRLLPGPENCAKGAKLIAPFQPSMAFGAPEVVVMALSLSDGE